MNDKRLSEIVGTPELDVVRVVSLAGGNILLVKEADDINWKLPGGKIHAGETIFEAFVREVEEELGFKPTEDGIVRYESAKIPDSENIRHIILVGEIDSKDIASTDEVEEARYFALSDLPETKFRGHILSAVEIITG